MSFSIVLGRHLADDAGLPKRSGINWPAPMSMNRRQADEQARLASRMTRGDPIHARRRHVRHGGQTAGYYPSPKRRRHHIEDGQETVRIFVAEDFIQASGCLLSLAQRVRLGQRQQRVLRP
jgi:hypothetical protein